MEHIYFEAQLCSEIATLKETSKKLNMCETSFDWWTYAKPNKQHKFTLDACKIMVRVLVYGGLCEVLEHLGLSGECLCELERARLAKYVYQ